MLDEIDLNVLRQIKNAICAQTRTLEKINENLEKINTTLECFGDFKP